MQPPYKYNNFWENITVIVVVAIIVLLFVLLVCKCHNTTEPYQFKRGEHATELAIITTCDSHNVVLFMKMKNQQQHVDPSFIKDITNQKFCHHCLEKTDIPRSNSTYI